MSNRPDRPARRWAPPRLYAVLDVDLADARGLDPVTVADIWLAEGVRLIQLRAKQLSFGPMTELASVLALRARASAATFIVNDRADVAALAGADGVHLGQDDLSPADVGPLLGASSIVGLSTHTSAQLTAALDSRVDYVAMGPVYATTTKARPDPVVGLEGVRQAAALAARASRPLVAIGGLAVDRAAAVLDAGAQSLAVASGLLDPDPRSAARRWLDAVGLQARRPR